MAGIQAYGSAMSSGLGNALIWTCSFLLGRPCLAPINPPTPIITYKHPAPLVQPYAFQYTADFTPAPGFFDIKMEDFDKPKASATTNKPTPTIHVEDTPCPFKLNRFLLSMQCLLSISLGHNIFALRHNIRKSKATRCKRDNTTLMRNWMASSLILQLYLLSCLSSVTVITVTSSALRLLQTNVVSVLAFCIIVILARLVVSNLLLMQEINLLKQVNGNQTQEIFNRFVGLSNHVTTEAQKTTKLGKRLEMVEMIIEGLKSTLMDELKSEMEPRLHANLKTEILDQLNPVIIGTAVKEFTKCMASTFVKSFLERSIRDFEASVMEKVTNAIGNAMEIASADMTEIRSLFDATTRRFEGAFTDVQEFEGRTQSLVVGLRDTFLGLINHVDLQGYYQQAAITKLVDFHSDNRSLQYWGEEMMRILPLTEGPDAAFENKIATVLCAIMSMQLASNRDIETLTWCHDQNREQIQRLGALVDIHTQNWNASNSVQMPAHSVSPFAQKPARDCARDARSSYGSEGLASSIFADSSSTPRATSFADGVFGTSYAETPSTFLREETRLYDLMDGSTPDY